MSERDQIVADLRRWMKQQKQAGVERVVIDSERMAQASALSRTAAPATTEPDPAAPQEALFEEKAVRAPGSKDPDLIATLSRTLRLDPFLLCTKQARPQDHHGPCPVLDLALLVLHRHHDTRRLVKNSDSRICGVDALTAGTGGTVGIDLEIIRIDIDIHLSRLGKNRDRR